MNPPNVVPRRPETERTVQELVPQLANKPELMELAGVVVPATSREPIEAEDLQHRDFEEGAFWRGIPAYRNVSAEEFLSTSFQMRHTVTSGGDVRAPLTGIVSEDFLADVLPMVRQHHERFDGRVLKL